MPPKKNAYTPRKASAVAPAPKRFPEIRIPAVRDATDEEKKLIFARRAFRSDMRRSPYFLPNPDRPRDIERYTDHYQARHTARVQDIRTNLLLFPEELQGIQSLKSGTRRPIARGPMIRPDVAEMYSMKRLEELERLAQLEKERAGKDDADDEEEEENEEEEAEEEEEYDDDYQMQFETGDDYDDDNMDGEGDGAVF